MSYRRRDYVLLASAGLLFVCALGLSVLGYGKLWIPGWALAWGGG